MTPVYQTNYGRGQGNCLTACVASLLDTPITALPEFCVDDGWFEKLHKFCEESGYFLLYWRHSERVPLLALGCYVILLLELEGHDELHAVIGKTKLESKIPVTDSEVENAFAITEGLGTKPGDVRWGWQTVLVHDPNQQGVPKTKGVFGYILIGKQ